MTLVFTLFSQEIEDFVLEIKADNKSTFKDLLRLINDHCHYTEDEGQRFLVCDDDWKVTAHVMKRDDGTTGFEEDVYLMDRSQLRDLIEEEGQKMAYVFDPQGKRILLLEVTDIEFGDSKVTEPTVTRRHGSAPLQVLEEETPAITKGNPTAETEEDVLSEEDEVEEDELDMEGFTIDD